MKRSLLVLAAVVSVPFAVVACDMLHAGGTPDASTDSSAPAATTAEPSAAPTPVAPAPHHATPHTPGAPSAATGDGGSAVIPPMPGLPTAIPSGLASALGLPSALPSSLPKAITIPSSIPIPPFPTALPSASAHK